MVGAMDWGTLSLLFLIWSYTRGLRNSMEICVKENIVFGPESSTSEGRKFSCYRLYLSFSNFAQYNVMWGGEGRGRSSRTCISVEVSYVIFFPWQQSSDFFVKSIPISDIRRIMVLSSSCMSRYAISSTFIFSTVLTVRQVPTTSFMLPKGEGVFAGFIPKCHHIVS